MSWPRFPGLSAGRDFNRIRLRNSHVVSLFRQLEMLLGAGILLSDSLDLLRRRFPDRRTRQVLDVVHAEVAGARCRLSAALAKFPRSFPESLLAVVTAGENAGSLALAQRFGELAERLSYEAAHRRDLQRACAYPAASITLAIGLGMFLVTVTLPRIEDLLMSLGGTLPPLTRFELAVADWARDRFAGIVVALLIMTATACALRCNARVRRLLDRGFLRIPVLGTAYRDSCVALFCRIYRSLYLSSLTAPEILEACIPLSKNEAYRSAIRTARSQITHGGIAVSTALEQSGLFPPLAMLVIETGEQSGRLADALQRVSDYFQAQARERLDSAIGLLNPVLTLAVVAGAGAILIAFFQALYHLADVSR
jgi:type II secretory pathway component PulF